MSKSCAAIQNSFSDYLDGAISGHEMQEISRHIDGFDDAPGCEACRSELDAWKAAQNAVCSLRPLKAPADLSLRLRVAISQEEAKRSVRVADRLSLAWENAVRPMLVQVSAGFAGSVVLIGGIVMLLGMVAAPQDVLANDEPLGAVTAPHYAYSTMSPGPVITEHDTPVVVQAMVDKAGRVYDFTIVSGPKDPDVRAQVANQLLNMVFTPASAFDVPIRGEAIVTFSGVSVRG